MKFIRKAYTLVELLVVMVIIGMLSSISIAGYRNYMVDARVAVIKKTVNDLYRYTVLYARETDQFYSEISLEEIVDRFGIDEPDYTQIAYVASDVDFFYEAILPDGSVLFADAPVLDSIIPKTYAQFERRLVAEPIDIIRPIRIEPQILILNPTTPLSGEYDYYAAGTPNGMAYFNELTDHERNTLIVATYDKGAFKPNPTRSFNYTTVKSPWERSASDQDFDNVLDYKDQCPKISGPASNNGCPIGDFDNDGVIDTIDNCPKIAGDKYNFGCPVKDYDKDGTYDDQDSCTEQPGPKSNKGCPIAKGDADGDGFPDKEDGCYLESAPKSENGCPELIQIVKPPVFINPVDITPIKSAPLILQKATSR